MPLTAKTLLIAVAVVIALATVGCADQTQDANRIISDMNTLIGQSNVLETDATDLIDDVNALDPTSPDASKATTMLAEISVLLEQDKANVAKVISLADELATLDVSEDIKTYALQQKEIAKLVQQGQSNTAGMVDAMTRLYDPAKSGDLTQAELDGFASELNEFIEKDEAIRDQIIAKSEASQEFFTGNLQ